MPMVLDHHRAADSATVAALWPYYIEGWSTLAKLADRYSSPEGRDFFSHVQSEIEEVLRELEEKLQSEPFEHRMKSTETGIPRRRDSDNTDRALLMEAANRLTYVAHKLSTALKSMDNFEIRMVLQRHI